MRTPHGQEEQHPFPYAGPRPDAVDIERMLVTIRAIEQSLKALRETLERLRMAAMPEAGQELFSLYGIFPPTDVTWEDFQKAKRSWLKEPEGI